MATYVNDLRLKEIATGDESGTWGTSTNTNLELIAEAFSFGTEAITTNADTHTTTIADGSTDPGRSIYLQYTGALNSDCTVTIGPNTVSKLWFIENATTDSGSSGPYNIIIKQGSGATVTVPNGQVKAIYSDGAGSGGKMVDAFTNLHVNGLTSSGALTGTTATFTTADNNSQLVLKSTDADANAGPRLDLTRDSASPADGDLAGQIRFLADNDAGEETGVGFIRASLEDVSDGTEDGAIEVQTRINGTNRSRLQFLSTETVFNDNSVDLDFRVETDTDANALFVQGSSNRVVLGFNAQTAVAAINPHLSVVGTDNGTTSIGIVRYSADTGGPRLVLSKSRNGSITTAGGTIVGSSDTTGMIMFSADDGSDMATRTARIQSQVSGTPGSNDMPGHLQFFTTADGASSETEHMRVTSAGNVAIGTTTASTLLTVAGDITATSSGPSIFLTDTDNNPDYQIKNGNGTLRIIDATNSHDRINCSSTETIINESSADLDFRVESNGSTRKFFVDGGDNIVCINTDAPRNIGTTGKRQFQMEGTSGVSSSFSITRNQNNGSGAAITLAKTRGTALGGTTLVQDGDVLGVLGFAAADGTNVEHLAAKIVGSINGTPAANDLPSMIEFFTASDGSVTLTERMRIDSTGNVGIGTSTNDVGARLELAANNSSAPLNTLRFTDTDTTTQANQQIGKIEFFSKDATGDGALVRAFINCFAEDTSPSAAISFAVNAGGSGTATEEAVRITSLGRVGINRTSPNGLLHLQSDSGSDAELYIQTSSSSDGSTICFGDDSSSTVGQIQYVHSNNSMRFRVQGSEVARFDASGRLLHGVTSGNAFLHQENPSNQTGHQITTINGYTKPHVQVASVSAASTNFFHFVGQTGDGSSVTSNAILIYGNGNIQNVNNSYGAVSDVKLKENIVDSGSQWEDIKAVRVRKYSMIADKESSPNRIGVIAQELESAGMGGLVLDIADRDEDFEELETSTKTVQYSVLYMKAIKALQEAMTRIEALEAKVQTLEEK